MKTLFALALVLLAVNLRAANPSIKSFRGTGGIGVTSNETTSIVTIDGSGIASGGGGTNSAIALAVNGTVMSSAATQVNLVLGTNILLTATNTPNGRVSVGIHVNSSAFQVGDGTVGVPSLGWASDADGTGTGLYRSAANTVGFTVNGGERLRVTQSTIDFGGATYLAWGSSIGTTDTTLIRDAPGTMAFKQAGAATNRLYRTFVNALPYFSGSQPTNAAWLESGFDGSLGWAFLRSMADGSNQTRQSLVLGINTNATLKLDTNGTVAISASLTLGDGTAAAPSLAWLSDADGTGAGLFRPTANAIGLSANGVERIRVGTTAIDVGVSSIYFGGSVGNPDALFSRDAAGTVGLRAASFGSLVTNRVYRSHTNAAYVSGSQPTNAAWLESGFDGSLGWAFLRSMADGSNQTTQPLVLGVSTNEMLKLNTNGTVVMKVPLVYQTGAGTVGHVLTQTAADGTVGWAAGGGGGGGATPLTQSNAWLRLQLQSCMLPTNNMPALDTGSNLVWRLLFDDTTAETAYWDFVLPDDYGTNATVVCTYSTLVAAAAKTNCFVFQTQVLKPLVSNNINVDSWTASGGVTNVIPTSNGWATNFSGNLSLSAVAGDFVRLKINRDAANVMDSSAGDTALHSIAIRYTKQ